MRKVHWHSTAPTDIGHLVMGKQYATYETSEFYCEDCGIVYKFPPTVKQ